MTTTIKVTTELRDRLKEQANRAGRTLGAHLADLADSADRAERMAELSAAVAATPEHLMASYEQESALWEAADLSDQRG